MTHNPLLPSSAAPTAAAPAPQVVAGPSTRFKPIDPMRVLRQYIWLIIIVGIIGIGLGITAAILFERYMPQYTSTAQLLITSELDDAWANPTDPTAAQDKGELLAIFMYNQMERIKSQDILDEVLKRPDVRDTQWFRSFPDRTRDAYEDLQENLKIDLIKGTSIIEVSFRGGKSEELERILTGIIRSYLNRYNIDLSLVTTDLRRTMSLEQAEARQLQEDIQKELGQYMHDHDLPRIQLEGTDAEITYRTLSERMADLEQLHQDYKQAYHDALIKYYTPQLADAPDQQEARDLSPQLQSQQRTLHSLQRQRRGLIQRMGPNHKMIRYLDQEIDVTLAEINRMRDEAYRSEERVRLSSMQKKIEVLQGQIDVLKPQMSEAADRLRDLTGKLTGYHRVNERLISANDRYKKSEELLEEMRMLDRRPEHQRIRLQQKPTEAELTFPNYPREIIGITLLCLMMTTGLVFLKEMMDERITSPIDVGLVPGAILVGVVPDASEDPVGPETVDGVVQKDPGGLMAESFRQVRTELLLRMDRHGYKTLMVVGAQAECGASTLASNLAISMAYQGRRVVIIDANLRRPSQCQLMGLDRTPGLAELLSGDVTLDQVLVRSNIEPHVALIPTGDGERTPPEVLESSGFAQLLRKLEDEFDIILIDAPPVLVVSDSKLLTKQVDAVAMVVRAKSEKRGMVGRMIKQLEGQRAELLGIILNGVRSSSGGYFRKNYKAFYRYRNTNGAQSDGNGHDDDELENKQKLEDVGLDESR